MCAKVNRADLAYRHIKQGIMNGNYCPSQHLVEARISNELGVSRHNIRIAFHRLQTEGLVHIETNRGAFVNSVSLEEVIDIMTAREIIEGAVTFMAATHIRPDQIRHLEECLDTMHSAISGFRYDLYSATNKTFHKIICDASNSTTIPYLIDLLNSRLARFPLRTFLVPGRCQRSLSEHEEILKSLKSGNSEEAETNAKKHVQNMKALIKKAWGLIHN